MSLKDHLACLGRNEFMARFGQAKRAGFIAQILDDLSWYELPLIHHSSTAK